MPPSVRTPPTEQSDEATARQLEVARAQGDAYLRAIRAMKDEAGRAGEVEAGDYIIGYAVEKAEGLYVPRGESLEWNEPSHENAHIEVTVRDAADNRFVPGLAVTVTIMDKTGRELGSHSHPFLWHPWLYHYGRNWVLPGDGEYTLRVHVSPPTFARHDRTNGQRYAGAMEVEFVGVHIRTGQKK